MIRTMVYNRDSGQYQIGDETLLAQSCRSSSEWVWADFDDIDSPLEAGLLESHFSFDPMAIADAKQDRPPQVRAV